MKVVAASCSNIQEVDPQPEWSEIRAERPDMLILLGDNRCGGDYSKALRQAARAEFVKALAPVTTGAEAYRIRHLGDADLVVLDESFDWALPATSGNDRDAISVTLGGLHQSNMAVTALSQHRAQLHARLGTRFRRDR